MGTAESSPSTARPDHEVPAGARRRRFTYAQKETFLAEVERCPLGKLNALLRKNGIYSSMLSTWLSDFCRPYWMLKCDRTP